MAARELKKIICIENVGKIRSCKPTGDVEFRRLTLIYAENGRGKTTLCDILRSLQTGNADYILGRGTLGLDGEPFVELRTSEANMRFKEGSWDSRLEPIAIYDGTFIHENVHAGEFVEHDQKRNLYGVIIGAEGVTLHRRVDDLDAKSRGAAAQVRQTQATVKAYAPAGVSVDDFVALQPEEDIEGKIEAKRAEVAALERASEIAAKAPLSQMVIPELPNRFESTLAKTIADVEADAEERIRRHVTEGTSGATEAWLSEGLRYEHPGSCPWCGQDTDHVELVGLYRAYFDESYKALKAEVEDVRRDTRELEGKSVELLIARVLEQNQSCTEFWKQFVSYEHPVLQPDELTEAVSALASAASALLDRKAVSILEPVLPDAQFAAATSQYRNAKARVDDYNASVDAANLSISGKKAATQAGDLAGAKKELARLGSVQRRFDAEVVAACDEYKKAIEDKRQIEAEKASAKAALDAHDGAVVPRFQQRINQLLRHFGTGFRIANVQHRYAGGKASTSYQLLINEVPVGLGDASTSIGQPSFRNTLSAGDRSTLALAFFLVQLELDPLLGEKVVVLDDPFNSQDSSRRACTQQQISRLAEKAAQVIVLSHEASFLRKVYDSMPSGSIRTLQLSRAGSDDTILVEWDIIEETRTDYHRDYFVLHRYVNEGQGQPRLVAGTIRIVLEEHLRNMFPNAFLGTEWLGDFIKKIREAGEGDRLSCMQRKLGELEDLNDFSKQYHHRTNPGGADTVPLDDGELRAYAERALDFVSAPAF